MSLIIFVFFSTCGLNAVFQSYAHTPSIAPDDDVFRHLSLVYSNNHAKMSRGVSCKQGSPKFDKGITNGAAWYPLTGMVIILMKHGWLLKFLRTEPLLNSDYNVYVIF